MDTRTRKRLMGQYTAMTHLLQRHYSALPAGKSYADILSEGIGAAMALGMVEVQREARSPRPILESVEEVPARARISRAEVAALRGGNVPPRRFCREAFGLGMSLPRGDL